MWGDVFCGVTDMLLLVRICCASAVVFIASTMNDKFAAVLRYCAYRSKWDCFFILALFTFVAMFYQLLARFAVHGRLRLFSINLVNFFFFFSRLTFRSVTSWHLECMLKSVRLHSCKSAFEVLVTARLWNENRSTPHLCIKCFEGTSETSHLPTDMKELECLTSYKIKRAYFAFLIAT